MTKPLDATSPMEVLETFTISDRAAAKLGSDLAEVVMSADAAIRQAVYKTVRECAELMCEDCRRQLKTIFAGGCYHVRPDGTLILCLSNSIRQARPESFK